MRQLSIRQFQRNFYKELKDVPFIVLRQEWVGEPGEKVSSNKPEFIVLAYSKDSLSLLQQQTEQSQQPVPSSTLIIPDNQLPYDHIKVESTPTIPSQSLKTRLKDFVTRKEHCDVCEVLERDGRLKDLEEHKQFWHTK